MDNITLVPFETLIDILLLLSLSDFANFARTCKLFNKITKSEEIILKRINSFCNNLSEIANKKFMDF